MNTDSLTLRSAERSRHIRLSAIRIARSIKSGTFRSLFRSHGIEFERVREYFLGDDIRSIDWNVTARMGKPYVKEFREERELPIFLIVDCSQSMMSSGKKCFAQAAETAALLAYAADHLESPFGSLVFHGEIERVLPPRMGHTAILKFVKQLEAFLHGDILPLRGTSLDRAISTSHILLRTRALVFVISDFRCKGFEESLGSLAQHHEVIAIRIDDDDETLFSLAGTFLCTDPETQENRRLPIHTHAFKRDWTRYRSEQLNQWHTMCKKRAIMPLVISTKEDAARSLSLFFAAREKLS